MSQTCPSSSHQLVAAAIAFRRARRKFPKDFGLFSWPVEYVRKDSKCNDKAIHRFNFKSEPLSSMKTCKKCEERFGCQEEIRNVRSNDVWPRFATTWNADPQTTRSVRENSSLLKRRKPGTTRKSCGGCACLRRPCRTTKRNVVVSFREDEKSNNRCSAGDATARRTSDETISCRNCGIQGKPNDYSSRENRASFEEPPRRKDERTSKTVNQQRSCLPRKSTTNNNLDLLYDRNCRTKNSVDFLANEHDENSSPEEEDGSIDFPNQLHGWENQSHEESIGPATGSERVIISQESIANCDCAGKHGEARSDSHSGRRYQHRRQAHLIRHETGRHENALDESLSVKTAASRASSSKESNRLCKDCALGRCSRNSAPVGSLREDHEAEEDEDRGARLDDACAIKHKDSMALLVEKFKNKKATSCSDDETIFKSDEDSPSRTKINAKTITESRTGDKEDYAEYEHSQDEDASCCRIHRNAQLSQTNKFHKRTSSKNLKSRRTRSRCCCSSKGTSCRQVF